MKRYLLILLIAPSLYADTYRYDLNANGHITVSPTDASTSGYATLAAAKAFNHSVNGVWAAGDTVYLTAGKTFPSGNLSVDVGKTGSTYFTLDGNEGKTGPGATLSHAGAASNQAALTVAASGVIIKNCNFANTGTTGYGMSANGNGTPITDVLVMDCAVTTVPSAAAGGIASFYQECGTNGAVSSTYIRCYANHPEGGTRDNFLYKATGTVASSSVRGKWVLIDCGASGCTSNISDNCMSVDNNVDVYIYGGDWHDSGGTVLAIGSSSNCLGRLYIAGSERGPCRVWNSHMGTSSYVHGDTARAIIANSVRDTWVYNISGIELSPGDTDGNTSTPDGGLSIASNCWVERDLSRESTYFSTNGYTSDCNTAAPVASATDAVCGGFGIYVNADCRNALIENCVIKNYSPASDGASASTNGNQVGAKYCSAVRAGAKNQTIVVRNCAIDNAYVGIDANIQKAHMVVQDCLITSTATARAGNTQPCAFNMNGADANTNKAAWTIANTVTDWRASGGYVMAGANTGFEMNTNYGGYNYFHASGGPTRQQFAQFTAWANDASSNASTNRPTFDAYYRELPTSPSYGAGGTDVSTDGLFNPTHIAYFSAITGTLTPPTFTTDFDSSSKGANYLKGQCIIWLGDATTALQGEITTIASHDANSSCTFTVFPRMSIVPANGDHGVVVPYIYPGSGQVGSLLNTVTAADGGMGTRSALMMVRNPLFNSTDIFGQQRPSLFYQSSGTDGTLRRRLGPFGLQKVVDMARPSMQRPGAQRGPKTPAPISPVEKRLR